MKKDKSFFKNTYNKICLYVSTNKLFLSYVFLAYIGTFLIKLFTSSNPTYIRNAIVELGIILILGSFCYFKKPNKRYSYLSIIIFFISLLGVIHTIYYRFYTSFGSINDLATLAHAEKVTGSIIDRLGFDTIIFVFLPIIFYLINKRLKYSSYFNYVSLLENSKKLLLTTLAIGSLFVGIRFALATPSDIASLRSQWNRGSIVSRFGVFFYQADDIVQAIKPKINSIFGYDDAMIMVKDYFNNKDTTYEHSNKYTGILKDKNLIFVHMESIQTFLMDLSFAGGEVTPNINKLAKEGMFFSNFYPEVSTGTSSDTEFTILTSLMPAASGTVFVSYYNRDYVTTTKLLVDKDYYTFSMHGNLSSMWNRSHVHPAFGYQDMYFRESFEFTNKDVINLGINDRLFFEQAIPILEKIEEEHEKYMGTIITLSNHSPFIFLDKYGEFDMTSKVVKTNPTTGQKTTTTTDYLSNSAVGKYIRSSHYADIAIGDFINYIKSSDYFNDTVFIFYGDHDAKLSRNELNYLYNYNPENGELYEEDDPNYVSYDNFDHALNKKTPLIIWTKNKELKKVFKGTNNYYMGMIDVQPTILNMLGLNNKYALGHDIFNIKNNNIIPFPNGSFVSSDMYYNNSTGEFKLLNNNQIIDADYVEKHSNEVNKLLNISNLLVTYDILRKLN